MKIIRNIVVACIVAEIIWMVFFVIPTLGVFRSVPDDPPVPVTGLALVTFDKRTMMDSLPLGWVTTGWAAVGKGWPLILFGVLVGYPFGENARRKFAIDTASKEAIQLGEKYAKEAAAREVNADRILKEAQALHSDYPQLKKKLAGAQRDIESLKMGVDYYRENYNDEHRGKESIEKELEKARAKIRRLIERDKRRKGKRVDDDLF